MHPDNEVASLEQRVKFLEDQRKITVARIAELQNAQSDWPTVAMIGLLVMSLVIIILGMTWIITK